MSIYGALWHLRFPRDSDDDMDGEWVDVLAQGVPAHVGTPTPGYGYESGDSYAAFRPPAQRIGDEASEDDLRAVVFVVAASKKGTSRSGQEYESPLLVLTGKEYIGMSFQVLSVPSVVIPSERNFVLNPAHVDFGRLTILPPEPFRFDSRMWNARR